MYGSNSKKEDKTGNNVRRNKRRNAVRRISKAAREANAEANAKALAESAEGEVVENKKWYRHLDSRDKSKSQPMTFRYGFAWGIFVSMAIVMVGLSL